MDFPEYRKLKDQDVMPSSAKLPYSMKQLDIRPLKEFARRKLPNSALKTVLLSEEDIIDYTRFLALIPLWLKLSHKLREVV